MRRVVMTKVIIRRKARKITNELDALDFAKAVNKASIPLNTKPKGLVLIRDKSEEQ